MADWYVNTALGTDDASHGTGRGALAFATIQYAVDFATVTSGDTIHVENGTYTEEVNVAEAGITIKAQSLATIVDGGFRCRVDDVTIDGFTIMNGGDFGHPTAYFPVGIGADDPADQSGHKFINNVIIGSGPDDPKSGIYTKNCTGTYIENNEIYGGCSRAIAFITESHDTIVVHNKIHDNLGGICPGESDDAIIRCNDVYDNVGEGMQLYKSDRLLVNLNNIHGNGTCGICYHTCPDLDARYNWWGATDGPSGDEAGSGDKLTCDNAPCTANVEELLIARALHQKDLSRNTLACVAKTLGGGFGCFRAPSDDYDSGIIVPDRIVRSRIHEDTGRISVAYRGLDESGDHINLMVVSDLTGNCLAVVRTPTKKYVVSVR